MPDFNAPLKPQRRHAGKPGLRKGAVLPTVILKEEDRQPLRRWQSTHGIPIHLWHVFYDLAFGLSFDEAERLIGEGVIEPTRQVFQAPGGATTEKTIYKFHHHFAYPLAEAEAEPTLVADSIVDKNGHILPFVRFQGGRCRLTEHSIRLLETAAAAKAQAP